MKIIEMYGLPGGGKSTICNRLLSEMRHCNKEIVTADEFVRDHCKKKDILRGIMTASGFLFFFRSLFVVARKGLLFEKSVVIRIMRILPLFSFYKEVSKKNITAVMDQAMIQQYISAFFDYGSLENKDFQCLLNAVEKHQIIPVYVKVSPDVSTCRIETRADASHGRCDEITNIVERKKVLSCQYKNFNAFEKLMTKDLSFVIQNDLPENERLLEEDKLIKELLHLI